MPASPEWYASFRGSNSIIPARRFVEWCKARGNAAYIEVRSRDSSRVWFPASAEIADEAKARGAKVVRQETYTGE